MARQLAPVISADTTVLSLQNGVLACEVLGRHIPDRQLLGGAACISAFITEPGTITPHGQLQRIVFGEFDGTHSDRVGRLDATLRQAGVDSVVATTSNTVELDNTLSDHRLRFCDGPPMTCRPRRPTTWRTADDASWTGSAGTAPPPPTGSSSSAPANRVIAAALAPYVDGQAP